MSEVLTVRGPVETADLGPTYMHERIFVLTADVQQNYPAEWGSEEDRVADAVAKLRALAAQGIRTIVDQTVTGNGVTEDQITTMLTANPRRFFENKA